MVAQAPSQDGSATAEGDTVRSFVPWVAAYALVMLIAAVVALSLFSRATDRAWAWTLRPPAMALFMAAGYTGGVYFFGRCLFEHRWHRVSLGFPPVAIFAWAELAATMLHLDRFHSGQVATVAWVSTYVVVSLVVPAIWLLGRLSRRPEGERPDMAVPRTVRLVAGVLGVAISACGVVLFVRPDLFTYAWPWTLTPLNGQVLGGWFLLSGILMVQFCGTASWSGWRIPIQSQMLATALILVAAAASWGDFHASKPVTFGYTVGFAGLLAALALLYARMERRRRVAESR
jgi:hypothetical protein